MCWGPVCLLVVSASSFVGTKQHILQAFGSFLALALQLLILNFVVEYQCHQLLELQSFSALPERRLTHFIWAQTPTRGKMQVILFWLSLGASFEYVQTFCFSSHHVFLFTWYVCRPGARVPWSSWCWISRRNWHHTTSDWISALWFWQHTGAWLWISVFVEILFRLFLLYFIPSK